MPFGIPTETFQQITAIIAGNPSVTKITLFGSRAKGNPKPGSDIDLAVSGNNLTLNDLIEAGVNIDRLDLAWKVDLVNGDKVDDPAVIDHINRAGIILYEKGEFRQYGLPPIMDDRSRILILGTFPSDLSLKQKEYYTDQANTFWNIIFALLQEPWSKNYEIRQKILRKHRIALWNVVDSCFRDGRGEMEIRDPRPVDLQKLKASSPSLRYLVFNGSAPLKIFHSLGLDSDPFVPVPFLPSTNSKYTRLSLSDKIERWKDIRWIL